MTLIEKRTRLGARLILKASSGPLSRPRDIRVAKHLASLKICDHCIYEDVFASLGHPDFRPWSTPGPAKDLWKTLGGRPTIADVKRVRAEGKPDMPDSGSGSV